MTSIQAKLNYKIYVHTFIQVVISIPETELESLRSFVAYSGGTVLKENNTRKRKALEPLKVPTEDGQTANDVSNSGEILTAKVKILILKGS